MNDNKVSRREIGGNVFPSLTPSIHSLPSVSKMAAGPRGGGGGYPKGFFE